MDHYNASESEIAADFLALIGATDSSKVGLGGDLFLTRREDSTVINRNYFRMFPYYRFRRGAVSARVGVKIVYEDDTINTDPLHFYPNAEIAFRLMKEVNVYGILDGDIQRNTLGSFVSENPFLDQQITLLNTNKLVEFQAGVRGSVLKYLSYGIGASYGDFARLPFFRNNLAGDSSKFEVIYRNGSLLTYSAELVFASGEKARLGVKGEVFDYSIENNEIPYHKPKSKITVNGNLNLNNKIYLTTEFYFLQGIETRLISQSVNTELKPIYDLNFGVDYRFSNKFSAFLHANNILAQNYQRYLYYPSRGINILAGISFSF